MSSIFFIRFSFCDIQNLIKVSVRVISLSLQVWLITLTSTLIILDITKPHPIIIVCNRVLIVAFSDFICT